MGTSQIISKIDIPAGNVSAAMVSDISHISGIFFEKNYYSRFLQFVSAATISFYTNTQNR